MRLLIELCVCIRVDAPAMPAVGTFDIEWIQLGPEACDHELKTEAKKVWHAA